MKFIEHYLILGNGMQAAIKAGYSPASAIQTASRMLTFENVSAELERRRAAMTEKMAGRYEVTIDRLVQELACIALSNMADYMKPSADGSPVLNFSNLTREQASALQEVTVEDFRDGRTQSRQVRRTKFKLANKQGAIELLGRHLGMFPDKVEKLPSLTTLDEILREIDSDSRRMRTIEHMPGEVLPDGK